MITRNEFNKMKYYKESKNLVNKGEITEFVKSHGATLNLEDTKTLLKEYFGIEEGVVVIKDTTNSCPVGAEEVHFKGDGNPSYIFAVTSFEYVGHKGRVGMRINNDHDPDQMYSGEDSGSGLFYFFLDGDYEVLVPK